jgi:hypothetical protein
MECKYHKTTHTEPYNHDDCVRHGHCLNPVQCPYFKDCPMHKNGSNMFLAWSARLE